MNLKHSHIKEGGMQYCFYTVIKHILVSPGRHAWCCSQLFTSSEWERGVNNEKKRTSNSGSFLTSAQRNDHDIKSVCDLSVLESYQKKMPPSFQRGEGFRRCWTITSIQMPSLRLLVSVVFIMMLLSHKPALCLTRANKQTLITDRNTVCVSRFVIVCLDCDMQWPSLLNKFTLCLTWPQPEEVSVSPTLKSKQRNKQTSFVSSSFCNCCSFLFTVWQKKENHIPIILMDIAI